MLNLVKYTYCLTLPCGVIWLSGLQVRHFVRRRPGRFPGRARLVRTAARRVLRRSRVAPGEGGKDAGAAATQSGQRPQ